MRVALVHDWMLHMRGGEKVLEALAELYPEAEIYTLICDKSKLSETLRSRKIHTSFFQYLPGIKNYYRWLLPIMPFAMRSLRIASADLVISSSHCVAKGIRIPSGAKHVTYCHTPMRYLWGYEEEYFGKFPRALRFMIQILFKWLKKWDLKTNQTVDLFVANSKNVQGRIKQYYNREAEVVYPPLNTEEYFPQGIQKKDYYLAVSAFVPYKKIDLVIDAFNEMPYDLKVIGSGPMEKSYRERAKSSKIEFLGNVNGSELRHCYEEAQALIFPTFEDFGIVPLEAQACATPVIAYNRGGALESVKSGVFFEEQTPKAIQDAVKEFEEKKISYTEVSEKVQWFRKESFKNQFQKLIAQIIKS